MSDVCISPLPIGTAPNKRKRRNFSQETQWGAMRRERAQRSHTPAGLQGGSRRRAPARFLRPALRSAPRRGRAIAVTSHPLRGPGSTPEPPAPQSWGGGAGRDIRCYLRQGWAHVSCKGPDSKYCRPRGPCRLLSRPLQHTGSLRQ